MDIDYSMVLNQRPFSQRLSEGLTGFGQLREFEAADQKRQLEMAALANKRTVLGQVPALIDNPQAISELALKNPAVAGDIESLLKSRQGILDDATKEAYSAALGPAMQAFDKGDRAPLDELMTKFPKQREDALKQMGLANKEQAEATGLLGLQLKMAAERGDSGVVNSLLASNGNILKRIGYDPTALAESYAKSPDEFIKRADNFAAFSLGPAKYNEYAKTGAEAKEAGVKAQYAEEVIKNDMEIKRINSRIYAMTAAAQREANDLKRQEMGLQIKNLEDARDQKILDKAAEAESASNNVAEMRKDVSSLRSHPGFSSLFGASITPGARFIPGSDTAGAEAALEKLKAGAFVLGAQKMRGLGALGEKEGAKVEKNLATLTPGMPEKDALRALAGVEEAMNRLDEMNAKKYGIPSGPPKPTTQAQYDALPPGTVYTDPDDGKQYRKP